MRLPVVILLAALALCWAAPRAHAQSCTIAATAAAFGTYSPTASTATTTNASITVNCQATIQLLISYSIALSAGSSGATSARTLQNGANLLAYQLYTNAARSQVWGDGTGGTSTVAQSYLLGAVTPVSTVSTAYGVIPALQNVAPGPYQDTLIVTVSW